MSTFHIPEVIQDIIYKNIHGLKMTNVMDELISNLKMCRSCDEIKIVQKNINPYTCICQEFICTICHEDCTEYMNYENLNYEQSKNIKTTYELPCLCGLLYEVSDDSSYTESVDEEFLMWQEMHGVFSSSEMY